MAQLIQMRQRIKAIESIKKITHAMRLVAMSGHSKLKYKEKWVRSYLNQTCDLFDTLTALAPVHTGPLVSLAKKKTNRTLVFLVGSQKGLCGNFNTSLFSLLEKHVHEFSGVHFVAIGKKAAEFLREHHDSAHIAADFSAFNTVTLKNSTGQLARFIIDNYADYDEVVVCSNQIKTFFIQTPTITRLLPFTSKEVKARMTIDDEYVWEQVPQELLHTAANLRLEAELYSLLFQSLFAEQAARFLSMDSSTRNAESLLELTKLQYNKLRQAKITKEITELASIDLAR